VLKKSTNKNLKIKYLSVNVAQVELDSLLTDEQLANCPVLILGNKIDRPGAAGEDELRYVEVG
jgi:hypothetical protein